MTDAAPEALKPCPFCGGKAKRFTLTDEANFGGDVIQCMGKCGASSHVEFDRKENLVSLWNERALSTPTPAGELREVVRREVIEECAKLAEGLALSARNAENDLTWSREQRSHFAACVVPLQEAAKMIRALAQPGSGEGV